MQMTDIENSYRELPDLITATYYFKLTLKQPMSSINRTHWLFYIVQGKHHDIIETKLHTYNTD